MRKPTRAKRLVPLVFGVAAMAVAGGLRVPAATPPVGETTKVVRDVRGVLEQTERQLNLQDTVYFNEVIESGPESATQITFADGTTLRMGPTSRLTLNRVVYDPETQTGDFVVEATRGVFEFATGKLAPERYKFETPSGTIGVRGTRFTLIVRDPVEGGVRDRVYVYLDEGGPIETLDCSGNRRTANVASPLDVTIQGVSAGGQPTEPLVVRLLNDAVLTGAPVDGSPGTRSLRVRLPEGVDAADIAELSVVSAQDAKTARQVPLRAADGATLAYTYARGTLTAYRAAAQTPSAENRVFELSLNDDGRTAVFTLHRPLEQPRNEQTIVMQRADEGCSTAVREGKLQPVQSGQTRVAVLLDPTDLEDVEPAAPPVVAPNPGERTRLFRRGIPALDNRVPVPSPLPVASPSLPSIPSPDVPIPSPELE
jgi:hypothetical protein